MSITKFIVKKCSVTWHSSVVLLRATSTLKFEFVGKINSGNSSTSNCQGEFIIQNKYKKICTMCPSNSIHLCRRFAVTHRNFLIYYTPINSEIYYAAHKCFHVANSVAIHASSFSSQNIFRFLNNKLSTDED